jgi:hypothetical protein
MSNVEAVIRMDLEFGDNVIYDAVPNYDGNNPVPSSITLIAVGEYGFMLLRVIDNPASKQ